MPREKTDNFDWLKKWIHKITPTDLIEKINDEGSNYVSTFKPGAWTILKEMALAYYADPYLKIMRNQKWVKHVSYIDLFAGSGIIGIEKLKKKYLGSPLIITHVVENKFDTYYFLDKQTNFVNQLKKLINMNNVKFMEGDSNIKIDDIISEISGDDHHSLIFIDPFSTEIKFETIRKLGNVKCDLIITLATEEIFRAIMQWRSNKYIKTDALNDFFGDDRWKKDLVDINSAQEIFDYYSKKIVNEAYKKPPVSTKIEKTIDGHYYFMLFTSTGGKSSRPDFFDVIDDFNKRIFSFSGEEIYKYFIHYVEGSGKSVDDWD